MDAEQARELIRNTRFCVLSTATLDGRPWVSPLFYNYDPASYRLVWESGKEAQHSRLVEANPGVAIVIARLIGRVPIQGVYLECRAREVPTEELGPALEVFKAGPHGKRESATRQVSDYIGDKPLRLYEAIPQRVYGLEQVQTDGGYTIDRRVELSLV